MEVCQKTYNEIIEALDGKYLFGCRDLVKHFIVAYLAGGHVLLEGPPGTGKTLAAKLLAQVLAKKFKRIQFTSDLLPSDIIGAHIFLPNKQEFEFIQGPVFTDFLLADEINRTPPRTQSALLEAMEEKQVTSEGKLFNLSSDFFVVATQNPRDFEGTFPLPEAQLDRFLFKINLEPTSIEMEAAILKQIMAGVLPPDLAQVPQIPLTNPQIFQEINSVTVDDSLMIYIAKILNETRVHPMVQWGSSTRAGIAFAKCARVLAAIDGRNHIIPDDIKELAVPILRHRLRLTSEAQVSQVDEAVVIEEIMSKVPYPS